MWTNLDMVDLDQINNIRKKKVYLRSSVFIKCRIEYSTPCILNDVLSFGVHSVNRWDLTYTLSNAVVTFRKGPGQICRIENLSKFRELAWISESSLWQSHSNRAPSVHLQDPSPSEMWRTLAGRRPNALPICQISDWPRAVNAISSAGHLRSGAGLGWMHVPWESSHFWAGLGWGAREVQNRWKSLQLFNSTWKWDEEWAIPKFWQRSHRSPHKFTDSSPDLPVYLVALATFTYSF